MAEKTNVVMKAKLKDGKSGKPVGEHLPFGLSLKIKKRSTRQYMEGFSGLLHTKMWGTTRVLRVW